MFSCIPRPPAPPHPARKPHNDRSDNAFSPSAMSTNTKHQLYKTELCHYWEEQGECRRGEQCWFAHGHHELRSIQRRPEYKTKECAAFVRTGSCKFGQRCTFIHPRFGYEDQNIHGGGHDTSSITRASSLMSRVGIRHAEPPTRCSFFSDSVSPSSAPVRTNWTPAASLASVTNSAINAMPATPPYALQALSITKQPLAQAHMRLSSRSSGSFGSTQSTSSSSSAFSVARMTTEQPSPHSPMRTGLHQPSALPTNLFPDLSPGDQEILYNLIVADNVARSYQLSPLESSDHCSTYAIQHQQSCVANATPSPLDTRAVSTWAMTPSSSMCTPKEPRRAGHGYLFDQ